MSNSISKLNVTDTKKQFLDSNGDPFYFNEYEKRANPEPPADLSYIQSIFRVLGIITIVLGGYYIAWRWAYSLNFKSPIFSSILIITETGSYLGLWFFVASLWTEIPITELEKKRDAVSLDNPTPQVDIFIATYNEDPELVRLSIQDAKKVIYQDLQKLKIYVLDDGNRKAMKKVAEEEEVLYLSRKNNHGYKAGNLSNGLFHSKGEFIVICDADTRLYPDFLQKTLGFFRDSEVAWVQTPQWFYDLHGGIDPKTYFQKLLPYIGKFIGNICHWFGIRRFLDDPFLSDPTIFYNIILNRRNAQNASFCCGAGSIHRRTALLDVAQSFAKRNGQDIKNVEHFRPFIFHISEDIYTSLETHSLKKWKSILYPRVLSKMLSPQDGLSRYKQLYRYALGTMDMAKNEHGIVFKKGLTFSQKLCYFSSVYSYICSIWSAIFLFIPIFYLFTEISPVGVPINDVLKKLVPFLVANELLQMFAYWGKNTFYPRIFSLGCFWINMKAIYSTYRKIPAKFDVTSKTIGEKDRFIRFVKPHIIIMILSILALIWSITKVSLGMSNTHIGILFLNYLWIVCNLILLGRFVLGMIWTWEKETVA